MTIESTHDLYANYAGVLGQLPDIDPDPMKTALLAVDIQYMDAHPDYGVGPSMKHLLPDQGRYYFDRLSETVLPRTAEVMRACRARGIPVLHSRNATEVSGGREIPWRRRFIGPEVVVGSQEAVFLEQVAPEAGELVFSKTTASVFNSTVFEFNLRNMGVETLIVAGVVTNMCVESTVRDGGDRGFQILLLEDCCAAMTAVEHANSMAFLDRRFANVMSSQQIIDWMKEA
jgi:nicotinamidase-related amidase